MSDWRYATALQVGASHKRAGVPCQDSLVCIADGENLVAVIADGAGSAKYSDVGAEIVVGTIARCLDPLVGSYNGQALEGAVREAISEARIAVYRTSEQRGIAAREFASTVLVVAANRHGAVCAHLGDGLIAVSESGFEWNYVFWPQRGEFTNSTFFLTDADAMDRLLIDALPPRVTDFALMSDGLEPLALTYSTRAPHDPFFNSLFAPLHRCAASGRSEFVTGLLNDLVSSPRIYTRVDDDIALVLATRRNPVPSPE